MEHQPNPNRLYRDPQNGRLCGVCAGLGDFFGFNVGVLRFLTLVGLVFFTPFVVIGYVALCFLLPRKPPEIEETSEEEQQFWRSVRRSPANTLGDVRHRFRDLESRLRRMEGYVTSDRFELDREFDNLRRQ